eukprot:7477390-Pyramimonas_sp.AAC.2
MERWGVVAGKQGWELEQSGHQAGLFPISPHPTSYLCYSSPPLPSSPSLLCLYPAPPPTSPPAWFVSAHPLHPPQPQPRCASGRTPFRFPSQSLRRARRMIGLSESGLGGGGAELPEAKWRAWRRIRTHGSPVMYNTFLDEDLNRLLRDVASYAHRLTFDRRVFALLDIQSRLEINSHMGNSGDWMHLIAGI